MKRSCLLEVKTSMPARRSRGPATLPAGGRHVRRRRVPLLSAPHALPDGERCGGDDRLLRRGVRGRGDRARAHPGRTEDHARRGGPERRCDHALRRLRRGSGGGLDAGGAWRQPCHPPPLRGQSRAPLGAGRGGGGGGDDAPGAAVLGRPVQFWGALYGRLRDPFGHEWSLIAQMEPVSDEELREGASQTWPEHAGD